MLHVKQRQKLYRLFADLFANPEVDLLQGLKAGEAAEAAQLLGIEPPQGFEALTLEGLAEQFTGLFVARMGGVPAPPYGSVYLDEGLLMGPSTAKVTDCYQQQGLVLEDATEPPDYLATELEFLYYLVGREEEGFGQRDLTAARAATAAQLDFLEQLLLPWLEPFAEKVAATGEATVYHWGAAALLGFCRQEQAWLQRLPQIA